MLRVMAMGLSLVPNHVNDEDPAGFSIELNALAFEPSIKLLPLTSLDLKIVIALRSWVESGTVAIQSSCARIYT